MTRHASREDAQRIAQAVVDGAVEWYHKPAYEKGKDLGRATTSIATEAAINVLTDGLGTLRKIEKAAEVADHFHDVEKGAERAAHAAEHLRDVERGLRAVDRAEETGKIRGLLPARGGPAGHIWPHEVANKTPAEIDRRARQLGLSPRGPDPAMGHGAYVDPQTGIQRVLSHPNGTTPHAHVNDPSGKRIDMHGDHVPSESPAAHLPIKHPSHQF